MSHRTCRTILEQPAEAALCFVDHYNTFGEDTNPEETVDLSLELAMDAALGLNVLSNLSWKMMEDKGWHVAGETEALTISQFVANVHGETSELWEAFRGKKLELACDKHEGMFNLGFRGDFILTCEEEELADIIIRVMDHAVKREIDLGRAVFVKTLYNATRPQRHGGKAA